MSKQRIATRRNGQTFKISVGGTEGYVVCGEFDDGSLAEIFIYLTKAGGTLHGFADAFAIAFSGALQWSNDHRETLRWLLDKLIGQKFEPHGDTGDMDLPHAHSIIDYIARKLHHLYVPDDHPVTI